LFGGGSQMIIQCEQCNTKFRLDDSKVTDKGVKVRCAKCRHVFTVTRESDETETQPDLDAMLNQPQPDFGAMFDESVAFTPGEQLSAPSDLQQESPVPATSSDAGFDYSDFVASDFADQGVPPEPAGFVPPQEEPASAPASGSVDFSFPSMDEEPGFAPEQNQTETVADGLDFGDADFGAGTADAYKEVPTDTSAFNFGDPGMELPSVAQSGAGTKDEGTFDFGDISMGPPPTAEPAAETGGANPFDFGGELSFGEKGVAPFSEAAEQAAPDALVSGIADSVGATDTLFAEEAPLPPVESNPEGTFSPGEISFGDEPAAEPEQQVLAGEPEPVPESPVAALGEAQGTSERDAEEGTLNKEPEPVMEAPQAVEEDLPPLSIASRRKQSPLFGVLIAVATVVVVAVLGFFGYTLFLEDKGKIVAEAGRITVRGVNASFVKNPVIGDLLVITGEAVNNFSKPRAAIQIKGMVYGANGQVQASKNAYCGNPLTKEQLSTLSLDKIEAVMANQFGDSLANMEVAPGKAIPFVIVVAKPPADAKDYGVEPIGSTVATGKQQ
jgi:predicted Zn finger-like uncharacterized protein